MPYDEPVVARHASLGFNAVEVMPVVENPPGNIGYGPSDQYAVQNEIYGGPDNFKAFVDAAHTAGLAVILDIVHNHWGPLRIVVPHEKRGI